MVCKSTGSPIRGVSLSQKASKDASATEGDANCRGKVMMVVVVVVVLMVVVVVVLVG
jgi:hypothetical protein